MGKSGIQWTDETWNPTTGCTRVSPGCDNCYAFALHDQRYVAKRAGKKVSGAQYDKPFSQVQLLGDDRLAEPLHWRKPRRVFIDSMADLFHEDVPDDYLDRVFAVMALSPAHTFQVLTKRPERMRAYVSKLIAGGRACSFAREVTAGVNTDRARRARAEAVAERTCAGPLPNVWLGVSAEDQERANERVPLLLETPAAVRFVSAEPLLGPIDFTAIRHAYEDQEWRTNVLAGEAWCENSTSASAYVDDGSVPTIDWLIVGGESGPRARQCELAWFRDLRDQCREAGVPFFMKQLGRYPSWQEHERGWCASAQRFNCTGLHALKLRDRHGGKWDQWPESVADLRVREFPAVPA